MWQIRLLLVVLILSSDTKASVNSASPVDTAEQFLDAFYSFDAERLKPLVVPGIDADNALYYQAWAQAAHYQIQTRRPCEVNEAGIAVCAVTVTDDFGTTLGYTATDTFTMGFDGSIVSSVTFEGDDPLIFTVLYLWIMVMKPEVLSGPCAGMFEGGDSPAECALAVAESAGEFVKWKASWGF